VAAQSLNRRSSYLSVRAKDYVHAHRSFNSTCSA
jgi:hypothetical protein